MTTKLILGLLLVALASGCEISRDSSVKRDFPPAIAVECYRALDEAREIIERVGIHEIVERNVIVLAVQGEVDRRGAWLYMSSRGSLDGVPKLVYGEASFQGDWVRIAVNPNDESDINYGVLLHEMLHHWLSSNGHYVGHHAAYGSYVNGW